MTTGNILRWTAYAFAMLLLTGAAVWMAQFMLRPPAIAAPQSMAAPVGAVEGDK